MREVYDAYIDLKAEHSKVYVVGYSMGGALALYLGSVFDIDKMVLVAPGLKIKDKLFEFVPLFALFLDKLESKNFISSGIPEIDYLDQEYWRYTWIKPGVEFRKLVKIVLKRLDNVDSSVFVIIGDKDPIISLDVVDELKSKGSFRDFKVEIIKGGDHSLFIKDKKEEVIDKIVNFFE